jgi:hypothetical protein
MSMKTARLYQDCDEHKIAEYTPRKRLPRKISGTDHLSERSNYRGANRDGGKIQGTIETDCAV